MHHEVVFDDEHRVFLAVEHGLFRIGRARHDLHARC
jgi:hypothetical protein